MLRRHENIVLSVKLEAVRLFQNNYDVCIWLSSSVVGAILVLEEYFLIPIITPILPIIKIGMTTAKTVI